MILIVCLTFIVTLSLISLPELALSPDPNYHLTVWLNQLTLSIFDPILKLALVEGAVFINLPAESVWFSVDPLTFMVVARDMESSSYPIRNSFTRDLPKVVCVSGSSVLINQRSKSNCFSTIEEEFALFCQILNIQRSVSLPTIVSFSADPGSISQVFTHYLLQSTHHLQAPRFCDIPKFYLIFKLGLQLFLIPHVFMH